MSKAFCAHCIDGTIGLKRVVFDDKVVLMCYRCRNEHPNKGGYNFDSHSPGEMRARTQRRPGMGDHN